MAKTMTRSQARRYGGSRPGDNSHRNEEIPQERPLSEIARGDTHIFRHNPGENSDSRRELPYDEFFRLYSVAWRSRRCSSLLNGLKGKEDGVYFLPLGFVPGPAVLLKIQDGQVRVVSATEEARPLMEFASDWGSVDSLPEEIQVGLERWQNLINGLGCEPSPWALDLASRLLKKGVVPNYLAMGFPVFHWESEEQPFGIVLVSTENKDEVEVSQVYNPTGLSDVPEKGTRITIEHLQFGGTNPLAKLLRTWAKMEGAARRVR